MRTVYAQKNKKIILGRQGEDRAVRVVWPGIVSDWSSLYGDGSFQLSVRRFGDENAYPVAVEVNGDDVCFTVTSTETAIAGNGKCELTYIANGSIAKSSTWETVVLNSFTGQAPSEPPEEPAKSWFTAIQGQIGNLADLATASKDNLVAAINEAAQSGGGSGGSLPFDEISGGNITEIDGKKVLTPLGGGVLYKTKSFVSENIYPEYYGKRSGSYGEFYDNYVDKPEAGKSYSVSVNGVQGEYVCFEDVDGDTCLGTPYDDIVSDGQWLIKFYNDGTASFYLFLSEEGTYLSFVFSGEFKE